MANTYPISGLVNAIHQSTFTRFGWQFSQETELQREQDDYSGSSGGTLVHVLNDEYSSATSMTCISCALEQGGISYYTYYTGALFHASVASSIAILFIIGALLCLFHAWCSVRMAKSGCCCCRQRTSSGKRTLETDRERRLREIEEEEETERARMYGDLPTSTRHALSLLIRTLATRNNNGPAAVDGVNGIPYTSLHQMEAEEAQQRRRVGDVVVGSGSSNSRPRYGDVPHLTSSELELNNSFSNNNNTAAAASLLAPHSLAALLQQRQQQQHQHHQISSAAGMHYIEDHSGEGGDDPTSGDVYWNPISNPTSSNKNNTFTQRLLSNDNYLYADDDVAMNNNNRNSQSTSIISTSTTATSEFSKEGGGSSNSRRVKGKRPMKVDEEDVRNDDDEEEEDEMKAALSLSATEYAASSVLPQSPSISKPHVYGADEYGNYNYIGVEDSTTAATASAPPFETTAPITDRTTSTTANTMTALASHSFWDGITRTPTHHKLITASSSSASSASSLRSSSGNSNSGDNMLDTYATAPASLRAAWEEEERHEYYGKSSTESSSSSSFENSNYDSSIIASTTSSTTTTLMNTHMTSINDSPGGSFPTTTHITGGNRRNISTLGRTSSSTTTPSHRPTKQSRCACTYFGYRGWCMPGSCYWHSRCCSHPRKNRFRAFSRTFNILLLSVFFSSIFICLFAGHTLSGSSPGSSSSASSSSPQEYRTIGDKFNVLYQNFFTARRSAAVAQVQTEGAWTYMEDSFMTVLNTPKTAPKQIEQAATLLQNSLSATYTWGTTVTGAVHRFEERSYSVASTFTALLSSLVAVGASSIAVVFLWTCCSTRGIRVGQGKTKKWSHTCMCVWSPSILGLLCLGTLQFVFPLLLVADMCAAPEQTVTQVLYNYTHDWNQISNLMNYGVLHTRRNGNNNDDSAVDDDDGYNAPSVTDDDPNGAGKYDDDDGSGSSSSSGSNSNTNGANYIGVFTPAGGLHPWLALSAQGYFSTCGASASGGNNSNNNTEASLEQDNNNNTPPPPVMLNMMSIYSGLITDSAKKLSTLQLLLSASHGYYSPTQQRNINTALQHLVYRMNLTTNASAIATSSLSCSSIYQPFQDIVTQTCSSGMYAEWLFLTVSMGIMSIAAMMLSGYLMYFWALWRHPLYADIYCDVIDGDGVYVDPALVAAAAKAKEIGEGMTNGDGFSSSLVIATTNHANNNSGSRGEGGDGSSSSGGGMTMSLSTAAATAVPLSPIYALDGGGSTPFIPTNSTGILANNTSVLPASPFSPLPQPPYQYHGGGGGGMMMMNNMMMMQATPPNNNQPTYYYNNNNNTNTLNNNNGSHNTSRLGTASTTAGYMHSHSLNSWVPASSSSSPSAGGSGGGGNGNGHYMYHSSLAAASATGTTTPASSSAAISSTHMNTNSHTQRRNNSDSPPSLPVRYYPDIHNYYTPAVASSMDTPTPPTPPPPAAPTSYYNGTYTVMNSSNTAATSTMASFPMINNSIGTLYGGVDTYTSSITAATAASASASSALPLSPPSAYGASNSNSTPTPTSATPSTPTTTIWTPFASPQPPTYSSVHQQQQQQQQQGSMTTTTTATTTMTTMNGRNVVVVGGSGSGEIPSNSTTITTTTTTPLPTPAGWYTSKYY